MSKDISKSIIRIIQDYCFKNSISSFVNEFSIFVTNQVLPLINAESVSSIKFYDIAKKRQDFFVANELDCKNFCNGLYKCLKNELKFCSFTTFHDYVLDFKRRIENGLFRGFPKDKTSEDTLRCVLALHIKDESFLEARMSSGQSDICVPSQKIVIETKLWSGEEYYNSGFPELDSYLQKQNYTEGYYVIFDYNKTDNEIIKSNGEVFDVIYNTKKIHVLFVKMNATRPSKIYKEQKKAT